MAFAIAPALANTIAQATKTAAYVQVIGTAVPTVANTATTVHTANTNADMRQINADAAAASHIKI